MLSVLILVVTISSAVIMNDTAMFVYVPLIFTISKIAKIDLPKAVVAIALAANIGSALTPIGNPQNIIVWRTYKLSIFEFVRSVSPYILLWITLLIAFIWIGSRNRSLEILPMPRVRINRGLMYISTLLLILNIILVEKDYSWVGLVIAISVLAIIGREALFSLDVALIAIFALIFIDFKEVSFLLSSYIKLEPSTIKIIILSAGLSQAISNVPATVMLASRNLPWFPLVIGVNLGGTGVIIGSLANFIAVRISGIGIGKFHRYSIPYFLVALLATLIVFYHNL